MMHEPVFVDEVTMGGDGTPVHPLFAISGGGGVTSLQGKTGALNLASIDGSMEITTPFPNTINLKINSIDGGIY
jgi:hypothetical protein